MTNVSVVGSIVRIKCQYLSASGFQARLFQMLLFIGHLGLACEYITGLRLWTVF